jgi:hypothetical protein
MIREGYTSGQRWSLKTEEDLSENEAAAWEIGRLVAGGYTSGYDPVWEVEMDKVMPREAFVQIIDDCVTVSIEATESNPALEFDSTFEDLESNPATAGFVTEEPDHKM